MSKPLSGKRIMVTRSPEQVSAFATQLSDAGAIPVSIPSIIVGPPKDWKPLDDAISRWNSYDLIIFTSSNGVDYFFKRLAHLKKDKSMFNGKETACVGRATAGTLLRHGVKTGFLPSVQTSATLAKEMGEARLKGKRVLAPRSDIAPDTFIKDIKAMGAIPDDVPTYHTAMPEESRKRAMQALTGKEVDIVTFTSSSTINSLMSLLGSDARRLINNVTVAVIGPVTAKTAEENNIRVDIMANENTTEGLVLALNEWAKKAGK